MREIEEYIDRIAETAKLAPSDENRLRTELSDHIGEFFSNMKTICGSDEEAIDRTLREFGNAENLGEMISDAKGRFRTYIKKNSAAALVALVLFAILILQFAYN